MKKGSVSLEYTWGGFLMVGLSWLTLFFRAKGEPRLKVMGRADEPRAARCETCGAVVIVPDFRPPDLCA